MNANKRLSFTVAVMLLFTLAACSNQHTDHTPDITTDPSAGEIYLYGETHGVASILNQELELWKTYYHEDGLRHLFVELPYYTAEFLNLHLQSDGEEILDAVYADWDGTASQTPAVKAFYQKLKETCPETRLHGTDVGHQYETTGKRYLEYLKAEGLQTTEQYLFAQLAVEQGEEFYRTSDYGYREKRMTENFIREFDALADESIMGIYGSAHIVEGTAYNSSDTVSMVTILLERYEDNLHIEELKEVTEPLRMETIEVMGKSYQSAYLGRQDLSQMLTDYQCRDFWRLEDAYSDVSSLPKTGDMLPYDNYPVAVEPGQVFVIDYTMKDGTVIRKYYRADGNDWQGRSATEEFVIE